MPITPANITRHELIGLAAKVLKSTNRAQVGIAGTVTDETRNLVVVETKGGDKKIQKKGTEFMFKLPGGRRVRVEGSVLLARPEDRVKSKVRRW